MRSAALGAAALLFAAFASPVSAATTIVADAGWTQILTVRDRPTEDAPFTFTVTSNSVLTFLDCCLGGDTYEVTGDLSGVTTFYAGAADAFGAIDAAYAPRWASTNFSKLVFNVAPGSYTFDVTGVTVQAFVNGVDVRLDTAAVPEPATWALMIGGFGAAGATLRRRRLKLAKSG